MISLLKKIFVDNWLRKLISLILAIIIWFVVDQSLTTTKTINSVGIRVINIPQGKTISGLQTSGLLNKRISITITGKKSHIEDLSPNDIEIVLDANGMGNEWAANLEKKHLVSLSPELSIAHHISKVVPKSLIIKLVPLAQEKIPVYVAQPIGEPPKGYQFLDLWPYHLNVTVSGPEEIIKKLKVRGLKLNFNLNDISHTDLERLNPNQQKDVVSFYVPDEWKMINLPSISERPLQIDDPDAKLLRLDFVRSDTIPLKFTIPINVYVPPSRTSQVNPANIHIINNELVQTLKGIKVLNKPLYAKGVSELFVKIVKDMLAVSINIMPSTDKEDIAWSIQFINPTMLEDRYVTMMMTEVMDDELKDMHPRLRQEYLRNRFRNYMNRFQLVGENGQNLDFDIMLKGKEMFITERKQKTDS